MQRIPTKTHAIADYATGALLLAAPSVLPLRTARARILLRASGATTLVASLLTDYELGVRRVLPMRAHLALDAGTGAMMASAPWTFGFARKGPLEWLPHVLVGATELVVASLSEREPRSSAQQVQGEVPGAGAPPQDGQAVHSAGVVRASSPPETPGPSVTAPVLPESDTERAEWAESQVPDVELLEDREQGPVDELVAQEEAAAAAEAGLIGGRVPDEERFAPEMRPLYEAGEGESEGFELAEADLIENATHAEGQGDPYRDAFTPEAESDESSAVYGEPDEEDVTEVVADPDEERDDDPGAGPNLAADR